MTRFYSGLIKLKKENQALWNGDYGGTMDSIKTHKERKIFAYYREKDENRVIVFLNLSKKNVSIKTKVRNLEGEYTDYFSGQKTILPLADSLRLEPWGYRVYVK